MCGGTDDGYDKNNATKGLSPRVRGNPRPPGWLIRSSGTIPACAGEPFTNSFGAALKKDYPRVCGGTELDDDLSANNGGLSPRVRGNRDQ